ncbi:MAG TPA: trypsin-like peptidase domain-containing protein [Candidatus Nanoarchaeia archaeon]|nr:trypsin-like peptidase domain-containing protein [Candidatus Nanoarchaeia archaeon]
MRKDNIIHIIYVIALLVTLTTVLTYDYFTTQETRYILGTEINKLNHELELTKTALRQSIDDLNEKSTTLEKSLSSEIEKKDTQIRALSGEIETVRSQSSEQLEELQSRVSSLKTEFSDFSDIIEEVIPAVVSVQSNVGKGSGFFVDTRGYIVTNYHVIDGATAAQVKTTNGNIYSIRVVGLQKNADIAVLKIEETVPRLRFGSSDNVRVGEKAIALGNAGGLDFTVTQGIVSAVDRKDAKGNEYVQIDVPINPGNSGGPLVDTSGNVIGVNTLKLAGFEGLGFALEADLVEEIVKQVIAADEQREVNK